MGHKWNLEEKTNKHIRNVTNITTANEQATRLLSM